MKYKSMKNRSMCLPCTIHYTLYSDMALSPMQTRLWNFKACGNNLLIWILAMSFNFFELDRNSAFHTRASCCAFCDEMHIECKRAARAFLQRRVYDSSHFDNLQKSGSVKQREERLQQADPLFQLSAALQGASNPMVSCWSLAFYPYFALHCFALQTIVWHCIALIYIDFH